MKIKKLTIIFLIIWFFTYQTVYADGLTKIEVFDASKGTVVRTIENTREIQNDLYKMIRQVKDVSPKAKIDFDNKETVFKIPIQPPIVRGDNVLLEAFIIRTSSNETILVCFDNKDHSYIYRFDYVIPLAEKLSKVK